MADTANIIAWCFYCHKSLSFSGESSHWRDKTNSAWCNDSINFNYHYPYKMSKLVQQLEIVEQTLQILQPEEQQ